MYGAYLAGLTLSYLSRPPRGGSRDQDSPNTRSDAVTEDPLSFHQAYCRTVGALQDHILAPLFFASIGFAVVCFTAVSTRQNTDLRT